MQILKQTAFSVYTNLTESHGMNMKSITIAAKIENVDTVVDLINEELEACDCPMKVSMQVAIAVEEIFVNIAHYAYTPGEGDATVAYGVDGNPRCITIRFEDSGMPYNPLEREDPDVTLSAEERDIGGLGVFMVKKTMSSVEYEHKGGKNILTLKKEF